MYFFIKITISNGIEKCCQFNKIFDVDVHLIFDQNPHNLFVACNRNKSEDTFTKFE